MARHRAIYRLLLLLERQRRRLEPLNQLPGTNHAVAQSARSRRTATNAWCGACS